MENITNKTITIANNIKNKIITTGTHIKGGRTAIFILIIIGIIVFGYSLSQNYRVGKTLEDMEIYNNIIKIDSRYISNHKLFNTKLKDVHVSTAFRPYLGRNQLLDYCSLEILQRTMQYGARCLFIDVFNSDLSQEAYPIVCNGFEMGNWKLSLNKLNFEDVIRTISNSAFSSGYVENYNDPLFIALNLKTAGNHYCVDKVKDIIVKYLKPKLLPSKFTGQQKNMGNTSLYELMGKVVIMCSSGYQNTELEELVNISWDKDTFNLIPFDSLGGDVEMQDARTILLDKEELKDENTRNLCMVIPPEDTLFTYNYPTLPYFRAGCQFIAVNYQLVNSDNTIECVDKFRESSIIEKLELD